MDDKKFVDILKIIVMVMLLAFVLVYSKYKTNDCHLCSFNVDGEYIGVGAFLDYYSSECFNLPKDLSILQNQTANNVQFER